MSDSLVDLSSRKMFPFSSLPTLISPSRYLQCKDCQVLRNYMDYIDIKGNVLPLE